MGGRPLKSSLSARSSGSQEEDERLHVEERTGQVGVHLRSFANVAWPRLVSQQKRRRTLAQCLA